MDHQFDLLLERLATALDAAAMPYMVIGGQAVIQYGEARFTQDIDLTLGVGVDDWRSGDAVLQSTGLVPRVRDYEGVAEAGHILLLLDPRSSIPVDVSLCGSPMERAALARVTRHMVGTANVAFASVEDLLIQKIFAGREHDHDDVRRMLRKQKKVDTVYVEDWLRQLGPAFDRDLLGDFRSLAPRR